MLRALALALCSVSLAWSCTSVYLIEQESHAKCLPGTSFGCEGYGNMYTRKCRGKFRCGDSNPIIKCGYPAGLERYICSCNGTSPNISPALHATAGQLAEWRAPFIGHRDVRSRLVVVPTHHGHFDVTLRLVRSLVLHAIDGGLVSLRLVVSQQAELREFQPAIRALTTGAWDMEVVKFSSILKSFNIRQPRTCFWCASPSASCCNKFRLQFLKKLYAARYFRGYTTLLVLDADLSFVLPSFSMKELFEAGGHGDQKRVLPLVLMPVNSEYERLNSVYTPCLDLLGKKTSPFFDERGTVLRPWGLQTWFWREQNVQQLFYFIESRHNKSLFDLSRDTFVGRIPRGRRCFESSLYWTFSHFQGLSAFHYITPKVVGGALGPGALAAAQQATRLSTRSYSADNLEFLGSLFLGHVKCSDATTLHRFLTTNRLLFLRFNEASGKEGQKKEQMCATKDAVECVILNATWAVAHYDSRFWEALRLRCKSRA